MIAIASFSSSRDDEDHPPRWLMAMMMMIIIFFIVILFLIMKHVGGALKSSPPTPPPPPIILPPLTITTLCHTGGRYTRRLPYSRAQKRAKTATHLPDAGFVHKPVAGAEPFRLPERLLDFWAPRDGRRVRGLSLGVLMGGRMVAGCCDWYGLCM
jgi:hypothetical protein